MGLYDRDYYQDDEYSEGSYFAPSRSGQRTMATNIIIVTVVFWLADQLGTVGWLSDVLRLRGDLFEHPLELYRLVTYGLTHARLDDPETMGILHLLFNMFILWMAGRDVESKYGRFEFLRFYLAALVVSGLTWVVLRMALGRTEDVLVGASGAVSAVLFLNIVLWPHRQLALFGIWPMPAWKLGVGIAVVEAVLMLTNSRVAYEAHLAGAAFGAAYGRFQWSLGQWSWDGRRWMDRLKPRPKLKVHDPEIFYEDLDKEADELLEKIHKYGEESLTADERRKLEDYSRRMRQKHR